MAGLTDRWRPMLFVACETNTHRSDAGRFGHLVHLRNLPVAHLALHSGIEVLAVSPSNARENVVHAHPRDWLARF